MARVLVVEDDKFLRSAYESILQKESYEVRIAESGHSALQAMMRWRPDIILLDLVLPGMDGTEFLKRFNAAKHPETKVVILSNFDRSKKFTEALELGATEYHLKSDTSPSGILEIIQQYIYKPIAT